MKRENVVVVEETSRLKVVGARQRYNNDPNDENEWK